jgi:hypothetical protein
MPTDPDDLKRRLANVQESLDTELKPWFDPREDNKRALIAKACMALRNNDGGVLVIGINDDGTPDNRGFIKEPRKTFHPDVVQDIVSKFSSERFETTVHFVERDGMERVMIEVPAGVRMPVICRQDLPKKGNAEGLEPGTLLEENAVYVRTLVANGRVSTSEAKLADWPRIMEHCFNNREADIGAFMRRQLSGIDISQTTAMLSEILQSARAPTPSEEADGQLDRCYAHFVELGKTHQPPAPSDVGTREASIVIAGDFTKPDLTEAFLLGLETTTPTYSGWRPWAAILNNRTREQGAYVLDDGWESFYFEMEMWRMLEFSRIDAEGRFYYVESLNGDLQKIGKPKTDLEFVYETDRVTEIVAIALCFARAFCGPKATNDLVITMRWKGLKDRYLSSMRDHRNFRAPRTAKQDVIVTHATIALDIATNAIGLHIERLVKPVFALFGGWSFDSSVIQRIVSNRLDTRI